MKWKWEMLLWHLVEISVKFLYLILFQLKYFLFYFIFIFILVNYYNNPAV